MPYKKESLDKLLILIGVICSDKNNEWFKERLILQLLDIKKSENNNNGFESFFKLLKKQFRIKANNFYESISDKNLKKQLIHDCVQMYWYQINNDVNQLFVYAFFQMENMLGFYASNSNCFDKIKQNKNYYTHSFSEKFNVICSKTFLDTDEKPVSMQKINIWSKLVYWAYDTDKVEYLIDQNNNFSNIINIRNSFIHKNSDKNKIQYFALDYIRNNDYTSFGFYTNLLKEILKTLENISQKVEIKKSKSTSINLSGPKILGKD